jgi:O-antigen ligase
MMFYFSLKTLRNLRFSLLIGLLLIGTAYLLPVSENTQYENRSVIWHTAIAAGLINPIAGGGFGNTELLLDSVIHKEHNSLIGSYIDSSHNIFLDWWVQGGLVGVGILAALFIFVIKNFYVEKRTFELILFLGLLVVFSLNPVSVISLIQLWWLIGQSFRKSFRP